VELPAAEIIYFDPVAERYQTKRSTPIDVEVTGESSSTAAEPHAGGGETPRDPAAMEPLRSIRRRASLTTRTASFHDRPWFLLIVILAPLGFLSLVVISRIRQRRDASQDAIRSRRAAGAAAKALRTISADDAEGLAAVARALNQFLSDRYGEPTSGLTRDELREYLRERSVDDAHIEQTATILDECEKRRYAGPGGAGARQLAEQARSVIKGLDASGRGRPS
jgi:hypothetical protein